MIICLPMPKAWVRSLGGEEPLEKEMAIHSSILAWKIPWTEKPGGLQYMVHTKELDTTEQLHFHFTFFIVQLSHSYMTTVKTIAFTRQTFVDKVMFLLLNMLSRLFIAFLFFWTGDSILT